VNILLSPSKRPITVLTTLSFLLFLVLAWHPQNPVFATTNPSKTTILSDILLVQESFETDGETTRYDTNTFDAGADFFYRTNSNPPTQFPLSIGGVNGTYFWASEDIASLGNPLGDTGPGVIRLKEQDVAFYDSIKVVVALAVDRVNNDPDGTPPINIWGNRWELNDFVRIQYAFDANSGGTNLLGGTYTTVGQFVGNDEFGGDLQQDTDLNGVANGGAPTINRTLTDYEFTIPNSGSSLSIQLRVDHDGGTEELAIDNIRVYGVIDPETAKCGLTTGIHTFNPSTNPVTMQINTLGTLDCLKVVPVNGDHPNATAGIANTSNIYWQILTIGSGFNINVTFPAVTVTGTVHKTCRTDNDGTTWDCTPDADGNAGTITRNNVTAFSDWQMCGDCGPTAIALQKMTVTREWEMPAFLIASLLALTLLTSGIVRRKQNQP
jgi:hypothetical protein